MELTVVQKRKHLLLLNRIMRTELKKDIITTPSKIPEEDVNKYFKQLFVKKDDYYVPIKNKAEIKIDEELFKALIKKPKMKEVEVEKPIEKKEEVKEVEKTKEEQIKEFYNVFNLYFAEYIFDNLSIIYNSLKTKNSIPFQNLKFIYKNKKEKAFDEQSYKALILKQLLTINKLNVFLDGMKKYKQKKDEVEKDKQNNKIEKDKEETIEKFKNIFKLYNPDDIYDILAEIAVDVGDKSVFFRNLKFYTRENLKWYKEKSYQNQILNELIKLNKLKEFFELLKEVDEFYKNK